MKMSRGVFGWVMFIVASLMLVMLVMRNSTPRQELSYSEFKKHIQDGNIAEAVISDDSVTGKLAESRGKSEPLEFEVNLLAGRIDPDKLFAELQKNNPNAEIRFGQGSSYFFQILMALVPWLLIFAFIIECNAAKHSPT